MIQITDGYCFLFFAENECSCAWASSLHSRQSQSPFLPTSCSYYPGQKKKRTILEIGGEKNAAPCVISCSIRSDQCRARSDPRLSATFALRWSCVIEHDITRGTAFFSPQISKMVLFFGQGSSLFANFCFALVMKFYFRVAICHIISSSLPLNLARFLFFFFGGGGLNGKCDLFRKIEKHEGCRKEHIGCPPRQFVVSWMLCNSACTLLPLRIRRAGYPIRHRFADFVLRYYMLVRGMKVGDKGSDKEKSQKILLRTLGESLWQVGRTKIFLKVTHLSV